MKKLGLAATILVASAVGAFAADMPVKYKAPVVPQEIYDWTGFYIGGQAGWARSSEDWFLIQNAVGFHFKQDGAIAGGYGGYNWQMGRNFVLGAELEGSWSNLRQNNVPCAINQAAICQNDVDWLGSVRGRAGFVVNQAMVYIAGGWAFDNARTNRQFLPLGGGPFTSGVSDTRNGGVVAVGVEWMFARNWIGRVEYAHYDFGSRTYLAPALSNVSDTRVSSNVDTVRVGLAYKFGGPVVAKY